MRSKKGALQKTMRSEVKTARSAVKGSLKRTVRTVQSAVGTTVTKTVRRTMRSENVSEVRVEDSENNSDA